MMIKNGELPASVCSRMQEADRRTDSGIGVLSATEDDDECCEGGGDGRPADRVAETAPDASPDMHDKKVDVDIAGLFSAAFFVMFIGGMMLGPLVVAAMCLWVGWLRLPLALYAAWVVVDAASASTGGWQSMGFRRWVRRWTVWRLFRDYFPSSLAFTAPVDPSRKYIMCYHPHGVYCISLFANVFFNPDFEERYGLNAIATTLPINFYLPIWRDFVLAMGTVSCDRPSILNALLKGTPGTCVALAVGGGEEFWYMRPRSMDLVLEKRKGFARLALATGASLLPAIGFGENELYERLQHPLVEPLHKLAYSLARMAVPLFVGRFLTPIPKRHSLNMVVGAPIHVDKIDHPSDQQIKDLHQRYITALQNLYDEHKQKYHAYRENDMHIAT